MKFEVYSRHPSNAFSRFADVPAKQDTTYLADKYEVSTRGLRSALKKLSDESASYTASHGNAAVHAEWIELAGKKLATGVLRYMDQKDFSDVESFRKAYTATNNTLRQVEKELDKRYEADRYNQYNPKLGTT